MCARTRERGRHALRDADGQGRVGRRPSTRASAPSNSTPPALETVDPALRGWQAFVPPRCRRTVRAATRARFEMARALNAATGETAASGQAPPISRLPDAQRLMPEPRQRARDPVVQAHPTIVDTGTGAR